MKTITYQEVQYSDYERLMDAVDKLIWELVYAPVVDLVRPAMPKNLSAAISPRELQESTARELHNAESAVLRKALKSGAVQMLQDPTGQSAVFAVSKPDRLITDALKSFGCSLNKTTGLWACPRAAVPAWVRAEAIGYATRLQATHDAVLRLTDDLEERVDRMVDEASLAKGADHAVSEVASGWKRTARELEVKPNLGPEGQQALRAAFVRSRGINIKSPGTRVGMVSVLEESTKREVKVWAKQALERLRDQVEQNAEHGYRAEALADRIRNEYGVSKTRADLIARQETSNFMANYHEATAADVGLRRYSWFSVRDARTRPDHKKLHGTVHRFDRPPVTDSRSGARNNPGQDFRCRCRARIVIE